MTKRIPSFCFYILLVFPTLSFPTPCAHHWLAWSATWVQQMPPPYFRDAAVLSCLQVCSSKHCRELHRAQFCSWVFCCPHREADGWWFLLLSGFSLSWEDFWANSPEQQQSGDELLGTKQTWKRTCCLCHPMECWSLTCPYCVMTPYGGYQTWQAICHAVGGAVLAQCRCYALVHKAPLHNKAERQLNLRRNLRGFPSSVLV